MRYKYDESFLRRYGKKQSDVREHHGVPFIFDSNDGWVIVPTLPPITREITSFPKRSTEAIPVHQEALKPLTHP